MENYVVLRPRLVWRLFGMICGFWGIYWILFGDGLSELQSKHWIFPFVEILCSLGLFLLFSCSYIVVTKDGRRMGLTFGYVINIFPIGRINSWDYEFINVGGFFPFYYIDAFKNQYRSFWFPFFAHFMDLVIFIQKENLGQQSYLENKKKIRRLAKKFRRLKRKHRVLYWILDNI